MKNIQIFVTIILFLLATSEQKAQLIHTENIHVELGIPLDNNASNDYLILRPQYALSYNSELNVPNWVSWNLHRGWFGGVPRYSGNFIQDTSLPAEFYKVKHTDYTNSGYDRGHMVRSEERTATAEDNKSTFLLTNIMPQTPTLNQQTWLSLEFECERLCKDQNKELFIIAGGIFGANPKRLNTVVSVPDSYWKIVVILDSGQRVSDITPATKVIAVLMKNEVYTSGTTDWKLYSTTVNAIEEKTGYDFLSDVPKEIQEMIESKNFVSVQEQVESTTLVISPNPVSNQLGIVFPGMVSKHYEIQIIDMMGRIIANDNVDLQVDADGMIRHQIDIRYLPQGAYSLIIGNGMNIYSSVFMKSE
ncbi:MAG: DNA/RNA non-specific endonuclease [Candidatus Kapaibacteriota bacterium]